MTRLLTVLAALWASPVLAQDISADFVSRSTNDGLVLRASDEAYAEIVYDNSSAMDSIPIDEVRVHGDLSVRIVVMVTGAAEKLWVYPSAGFVADTGYAEVLDGDKITIRIRYAMF